MVLLREPWTQSFPFCWPTPRVPRNQEWRANSTRTSPSSRSNQQNQPFKGAELDKSLRGHQLADPSSPSFEKNKSTQVGSTTDSKIQLRKPMKRLLRSFWWNRCTGVLLPYEAPRSVQPFFVFLTSYVSFVWMQALDSFISPIPSFNGDILILAVPVLAWSPGDEPMSDPSASASSSASCSKTQVC
jgi:hypothetical protein